MPFAAKFRHVRRFFIRQRHGSSSVSFFNNLTAFHGERRSGHYEIVFAKPNLARGWHGIDVALAARKGRVLARAAYQD